MDAEKEALFQKYTHSGFSKDQLDEIEKGIEQEVDICLFARTGIPAFEMNYIRKVLLLKKETSPEITEEEEDFDLIDKQFEEYKESVHVNVYEKIIAFAVMIAGLALIAAFYAMLMSWPIVKG